MTSTETNIFFSRNAGLISEAEQQQLADTTIAIIGTGGDGGLLAERLVRFGIGKIILADPEAFEESNINRQFASGKKTLGQNKAEAVARELLLINPALKIKVYKQGITPDNVREIVTNADILVDEIEYSLPAISVLLHREARLQDKYVFVGANIGWGASVLCFSPGGKTFEEHFEYNAKEKTINPLRYLKSVPKCIEQKTIDLVLSGNMPMPAVSSSVSLVAGIISGEIIYFITGKRKPVIVPEFIFIDLYDLTIDKS